MCVCTYVCVCVQMIVSLTHTCTNNNNNNLCSIYTYILLYIQSIIYNIEAETSSILKSIIENVMLSYNTEFIFTFQVYTMYIFLFKESYFH